jgi:hypothetical protein
MGVSACDLQEAQPEEQILAADTNDTAALAAATPIDKVVFKNTAKNTTVTVSVIDDTGTKSKEKKVAPGKQVEFDLSDVSPSSKIKKININVPKGATEELSYTKTQEGGTVTVTIKRKRVFAV